MKEINLSVVQSGLSSIMANALRSRNPPHSELRERTC